MSTVNMAINTIDIVEMPVQRRPLAFWQTPANRKKRKVVDEIESYGEWEALSCDDDAGLLESVPLVSGMRRSPSATSQNSEETQSSTRTRVEVPAARCTVSQYNRRCDASVRTVGVSRPRQLANRPKRVDWRDGERGIMTVPGPCPEPYRSCGFA